MKIALQNLKDTLTDILATAKFAELWAAGISLGWGCQMILAPHLPGYDVVGAYLTAFAHLPLAAIGASLFVIGAMQAVALLTRAQGVRLVCLMGEFVFFLFCWMALVKGRAPLPGTFVLPSYYAAMGVRFLCIALKMSD